MKIRRGRATVIGGNMPRVRPCFTLATNRDASSQEVIVSNITAETLAIPVIPLRELLPWAVFGGLLLLLAIYFVGTEEGATSLISGMYVHEFVHDGRHLLSFPCH